MARIVPNLDFVALLPTKASLSNFLQMLRKVYTNLALTFNGKIGFGDGTNFDNISGTWANTTAPAAPNTDFTITHNLGRVPVGYWVMQKDRACDVYTGSVAATTTQLTLRATVASAVLRLFIVGILLFFASVAQAQTTSVTLQVTDLGGQAWNLGTWSVVLVSKQGAVPFGPPFNIPGSGPVPNQFQTGNFDATGTATMVLTQNSAIVPTQSQWRFTVCPQATSPCFDQAFIIAGATQSISPTPPAISVSCGAQTKAYSDSEVLCQQGGFYYGLTLNQIRLCTSSVLPNTCLTWIGSAGTAAAGGIPIQTQVNNANIIAGTPCESFGNLTLGPENVDCDLHSKGPNPNVDIMRFGARTCQSGNAPCASGITASINNGSTSATVSTSSCPGQAGSVCFVNGDGVVIYGAGASQSLTTPTGLTVTNVLAVAGTGTGIINSSATGSTTRCYKIIARDTGGGFTPASSEVCNTTGQATLGAVTINLTSCFRSVVTVTCTTASATPLLVGGGGSQLGEVYIGGGQGTIDNSFRGFYEVQTATDSTHFTVVNNTISTLNGALTSTAGGTATFYVANHLTWNAVTGAWLYYIYGGASGAETLIGISRPNQTVAGNLDTTFDDFGPILMASYIFPPWIPITPPTVGQNDNLSTTIVSGAGTTTLTLANAAGATVAGAGIRIDAGVAIAKAATLAGPFAPIYIPNDPSQIGLPFVVNNFCDLRATKVAIYQSGSLFLNETLAIGFNAAPIGTVKWTGTQNTASNGIAGSSGGGAADVAIKEAVPGVYDGGGNNVFVDGVSFHSVATNGALVFLVDGAAGAFNTQIANSSFTSSLNTGDLMGFGLYLRFESDTYIDKSAFSDGNSLDGTSHNSPLFCSACGAIHILSSSAAHRGYIVSGNPGSGPVTVDNTHYNGGGTPLLATTGNGYFVYLGHGLVMDTVGHQCLANLTGKTIVNNDTCNPSGYPPFNGPPITGPVQFSNGGNGLFNFENSLLTNQITSGQRFSDGTPDVSQAFLGPGSMSVGSQDSVVVSNAIQPAPTCVVSAGGSIAVGTYIFLVVPFWQGNTEGAASAVSAPCATTTGNQTLTVSWAVAPGNPTGYRIYAGSPGTGLGFQTGAGLVNGTSFVFTSLVSGFILSPTVSLGGPTMLMPGVQGVAAPAYVTSASGGFASTSTAPVLTANRSTASPDASGTIIVSTYQNTAYDNFNRANGAIGSNWTVNLGGFNVSSNTVIGTAGTNDAFWSATPLFSNSGQFAQTTITTLNGANDLVGPAVFVQPSGDNLYSCFESTTNIFIQVRTQGGGVTNLATSASTGAPGDVLRLEATVSGATTTLKCFRNAALILGPVTNAQFTSGSPGIFQSGTVATQDNWSGGNLHPIAQLDTEQDWTQPQHFTQPVTIGPTNPVPGALTLGVYSPAFISQTANPAVAAQVRLASTDAINFRNFANSADISIAKLGAASGNLPANVITIDSASGLLSPFWVSNSANPAVAGQGRLASTDTINWRNNANSADVSLGKNTSDQLTFGGSIVAIGVLQSVNSTTTTCPTGAAAGSTCTFTVTWPTAFADAAYTPSCIGGGTITGFPFIQGFSSKTTTALTVVVVNGTSNEAVASGYSEMDCIGRHP